MPTFFINSDSFKASNAFVATLGAAPGSTYLGQIISAGLPTAANAMLAAMSATTAAGRATAIAANLGLTGAAATSAESYLTTVTFAGAASTHGQALLTALDLFTTLQSDATFGAAASAYIARVNTALAYSSVAANNSTDLTTLAAAVGAAGSSGAGSTFTLTTGVDTISGTAGTDTIGGTDAQFSAVDTINGGAGIDTLNLSRNASYGGGATISNVEIISINSTVSDAAGTAGGTFALSGISGITTVRNNASSNDATGGNDVTSFTGIGSLANLSVISTSGDTTFAYADTAVAGTADAVTLSMSAVGAANAATVNINNTTTVTGATGIETLTVEAAGAIGTATNSVTLTTNSTQSLVRVNFTGASAANVTMGTNLTTTAVTLDANAMTGALTLAGLGAATHVVTGGSGNDSFAFGGNFTSADTVNGGAGTDTISSTAANFAAITTTATRVSNIETIQTTDANIATATTINLAHFGARNFRYAGDSASNGVVTIDNIGNDANVRIDATVAAAADLVLNVTDATLPGTANSLTLDVRGTSQTHRATIAGVETLTINASNAVTAQTSAFTAASLTTLNLVNTGAATMDTGTLGANVSTVTAAGVTGTGAVTIALNGTANTGANVTGSANADTLGGSNLVDIINGGAGGDTISGNAGADRMTGGSGADTFTQATPSGDSAVAGGYAASGAIPTAAFSTTGMDLILDFVATDKVQLTGLTTSTTLLKNGNTLGANTAGDVALVRGTYSSSASTFTADANGVDSALVYDTNGTTGAGTTYEAIILVGYVDTGTADTISNGGLFTGVA